MNAAYTCSTAAALVRCPDSVPPKYFSNKNAQHPAECAGQQRLNFEDLLELRVLTLLTHTCQLPWSATFNLSKTQTEKLRTPYPLSDLRNLSEMKNDPQMTDRLLSVPDDETPRAEFTRAITALIDSLGFYVNKPVRWNVGRDMNIARAGASVVIDPAVKDGVPTILGTEVTTLSAVERTMAFPYEDIKNARQLGITIPQLQVASIHERVPTIHRPLGHMPAGRWRFGVPGNPENTARLVDQLLVRPAADEDPEEAEPDRADRTLQLRTA